MDFREFRSQVVKVPISFEGEEFWVGYRPREILEADLEMLAWLNQARVAEVDAEEMAAAAGPPAEPNRAARRRIEKAERVAKATPRSKKPERQIPTLIDHMKRLIADWSLTWDGDPWPVCEESFRQIEPLMRTVMISAIVEDYLDRPNRMSSSPRSSEETTGSGPTGPTSASAPSSGATTAADPEAASSPGI